MRARLGETGILSDDKRATAVFQEEAKEYRAENPRQRRILRYRVDGQMVTDGERCDFLMGVPQLNGVYLIELKGANLKKTASQILATLRSLENRIAPYRWHARVVVSRVQRPAVRPAIVIKLEKRLAARGGRLRYASQVLVEHI